MSLFVRMPLSFPLFSSTTGIPEILCFSLILSASDKRLLGLIVTGLTTIPDSKRFTLLTSSDCFKISKFL